MGGAVKKASKFTLLGGGKDLLFGKKDPGVADRFLGLDPSLRKTVEAGRAQQQEQLKLLGAERERLLAGPGAGALARLTAGKQERQARAGAEDVKRRSQALVAQRGLGGSSIGLRSLLGADRAAGERIGAIRASTPLLQQQFQAQRLGQIGQIGSGIRGVLGTPGAQRAFVQGRESRGRGGGLVGLASTVGGAALGAKFGRPGAGAQAGAGFGQSLANL